MRFYVLDEPWIPVVRLNGTSDMLGIRAVLEQAHELKEISVASPLEEYSIHRFLSVFLMDALRPTELCDIRNLLCHGKFDMTQIERYIAQCQSEGVSFDLFDRERPFMQSVYNEELDPKTKPVGTLDCFRPSGNNHTHFEHIPPEKHAVPIDKAMRLLLTIQQFCTAQGSGYPSGVNASPPYFGVIKGNNLFETLIFTLVPMESIEIPFDAPPVIWRETEGVESKKDVEHTSWLRGMFFPARRVCLHPPKDDMLVRSIYLSQGENFRSKESWTDPFVSYRTLKDGTRAPLRPNGDKPIWRSMYDIIDIGGNHASFLLTQYSQLTDNPYVELTLYGVETDNAKYCDLMRHDLHFRSDLMANAEFIFLLKCAVESAERLARKLKHCLQDDNLLPQSAVNSVVAQFYNTVEKRFWKLCDTQVTEDTIRDLYRQWCADIGNDARKSFKTATNNVILRGRALANAEQQAIWLNAEIKKIKEEAENDG